MKNPYVSRLWAPALLLGAATFSPMACVLANGQAPQVPTPANAAIEPLLGKARALEARDRMDLAAQTWQQILLTEPGNAEALGGLARAARLSGDQPLSNRYLDRLRAINPTDPGIARAEQTGTNASHDTQLRNAGKLAKSGQYAQAMNIYRQVYGAQPPPGDAALGYYETESATGEGRPHAVAGLRAMAEHFPADPRYQVLLGRILTYDPRTRAEGRRLLESHPADPGAAEALRQSLVWDAQNPATAADIRAYLNHHPDAQLEGILEHEPKASRARPQSAAERASAAVNATRTAEDREAYRALNAKHLDAAETRFRAILEKHPNDPNALAGMGYLRMQQANFSGAISFLVQAKQDGSKDPGLEAALSTSRFWNTMSEGAIALNEANPPEAERQYRAALQMRPASTEALEGLGGTLLKAGQPEAASDVFNQYVRLKPQAPHAWRGLFLAEAGQDRPLDALEVDQRLPSAVRVQLDRDPLYLRSLASAYSAAGRGADAERVLGAALDLPFPADAQAVAAETRIEFAGLLEQANHLDQAAGLYRQVLDQQPTNAAAYQGLIRLQHLTGHDHEAIETIEAMQPALYARAMRDIGFELTVASIYQAVGRLDVAQQILEKSIEFEISQSGQPSVPVQLQLAGIYLEQGNAPQAFPLYQQVLALNPERLDAWKGLLTALHTTGRDREALAEVQQMPPALRARLEGDIDFLETVGAVYASLGQPQEAAVFLRRVEAHYAAERTPPPVNVDIQIAWLMFNAADDAGLYRQLMELGGRADLNDAQRRTVQTIWTNFAVRRASQAAAAGNNRRSLAILNATAHTFPGNLEVTKALAGGYATAGMPKQSVAIWKSIDLEKAKPDDYRGAVGAALAADDRKAAETWLRFALAEYPKNPQLLLLAAKFEQQRGDAKRAAAYYKASLAAMPQDDPGAPLETELGHSTPSADLPASIRATGDLAALLEPGPDAPPAGRGMVPAAVKQPYLPGGLGYTLAPSAEPVRQDPGPAYPAQQGADPQGAAPQYAAPQYAAPQYPALRYPASQYRLPGGSGASDPGSGPVLAPQSPASKSRLKDYAPPASLNQPLPAMRTEHPAAVAVLRPQEDQHMFTPAMYQQASSVEVQAELPAHAGTRSQAHAVRVTPAQPGQDRFFVVPATLGSSRPAHAAPRPEETAPGQSSAFRAAAFYPPVQQGQQARPLTSEPAQSHDSAKQPADEPGGKSVYGAWLPRAQALQAQDPPAPGARPMSSTSLDSLPEQAFHEQASREGSAHADYSPSNYPPSNLPPSNYPQSSYAPPQQARRAMPRAAYPTVEIPQPHTLRPLTARPAPGAPAAVRDEHAASQRPDDSYTTDPLAGQVDTSPGAFPGTQPRPDSDPLPGAPRSQAGTSVARRISAPTETGTQSKVRSSAGASSSSSAIAASAIPPPGPGPVARLKPGRDAQTVSAMSDTAHGAALTFTSQSQSQLDVESAIPTQQVLDLRTPRAPIAMAENAPEAREGTLIQPLAIQAVVIQPLTFQPLTFQPVAFLPAAQVQVPAPLQATSATAAPTLPSLPQTAQQPGDSDAQQYPQPGVGSGTASNPGSRTANTLRGNARTRIHAHARAAARDFVSPAAPSAPSAHQYAPGLSYPSVGSPLGYQPNPPAASAYPLPAAPTDQDLADRNLPPLRGSYYTGPTLAPSMPLSERQQAERDLAALEASYSGWAGGTGSARYRSGVVGYDRLSDLEVTAEASYVAGNSVRFTVVPRSIFLNSGTLDVTSYTGITGSPVIGTFNTTTAAASPTQQSASGIGGELQATGRNFGLALGYTPYQFLVQNVTGRALFKPNNHFTLFFNRDSVKETQLSYAGLRDPGSATAVYGGNIWGGVINTGGGARFDFGDERAGFYLSGEGGRLNGHHTLDNTRFEGSMGAYFLAHTFPGYGKLNVGVSLFGMHYAQNERPLSYGLGGYFSPQAYVLASVPITFAGRSGNNFHYTVAGAVGVQSFQEDSQLYFPLDRAVETGFQTALNCTTAQFAARTCGVYPLNSSTGGNYNVNAQGAYKVADHWFAGGFVSANNTNNYNTVTGGFFVRYLFRPQVDTEDAPTGLFPVEGFRPLRVP